MQSWLPGPVCVQVACSLQSSSSPWQRKAGFTASSLEQHRRLTQQASRDAKQKLNGLSYQTSPVQPSAHWHSNMCRPS